MRWLFLGVIWLLAVACLLVAIGLILLLVSKRKRLFVSTRKEVLAFWYGWYGTPAYSGQWHGWGTVDEAARTCSPTTFYPLNGPYDSHDPRLVLQQIALAQQSGISGFIASWWGPNQFSDHSLNVLVSQANVTNGFKVSAYYETASHNGAPATVDIAVSNLLHLLNTYASNPCWLVLKGKPVIFTYGRVMNQFTLTQWREIQRQVVSAYPRGMALIAQATHQVPMGTAPAPFLGLHQYTQAQHLGGFSTLQHCLNWANHHFLTIVSKQVSNAVTTLTIIPGFDNNNPDTLQHEKLRTVDRYNGQLYEGLWQAAIAAQPEWVLISTYNEWHEGSQIEPSYQMGNLYTQLTAHHAAQFMAG